MTGLGAAVKNLTHSASLSLEVNDTPSHCGTEHLGNRCRQYFGGDRSLKRILILEEKPYRYQAALSDMSGCDTLKHDGDYQTAERQVRNWLASETESMTDGASRVLTRYEDFQGWYYDRQLSQGFSKEDIEDYPTRELLDAMRDWVSEGKPV